MQQRIPVFTLQCHVGEINKFHVVIEIYCAQRLCPRRSAKEMTVVIQEKGWTTPALRTQQRGRVEHVARGSFWIDEHNIDAEFFQTIADVRKTVQHLKAALARLADADYDQPPIAGQILWQQVRIVLGQQRYLCVYNIDLARYSSEKPLSCEVNHVSGEIDQPFVLSL